MDLCPIPLSKLLINDINANQPVLWEVKGSEGFGGFGLQTGV